MSAETTFPLDLSDLDMLDDDKVHASCDLCGPEVIPPMTVFPALCGVMALARLGKTTREVPPNACDGCLNAYSCPRCMA